VRGLRSFLILLVVALGLGAYVYFVESKREPGEQKKQEKVFADLKSDKIDQVTIRSEKGDTTTVQKQGAAWQITKPETAAADEAEISGITSNLASMEIQRVVDDHPGSDIKQYGLDPAKIDVAFTAGGKPRTLLLGQKTPTGSDLYAKLPDSPRVFLVPSYLETTFNKSSFDLRDKTILKIDRDKTDHLEVQTPDRTITFVKQGPDWQITSPVHARADFNAIEGILGRLNTTQMKSITASSVTDPKDLKQYGLDKPAITVRLGAGSAQAGLAIGKSAGEGVVYAKDVSRPMVFTVESALVDELKKPADDYRVKDLFEARSFNTTRIDVARKGQTVAFEKDKETWKQVAPAAKPVDGAKVDALITALTNTRAASFVDTIAGTGLDNPELTVTIKYEDGQKQEKVSFGRSGSDAYARREADASAAKIDSSALDAINKALDALK
jgi:hypothetical protein